MASLLLSNIVPLLIATLIQTLMGGFYYSPALFGNTFIRLHYRGRSIPMGNEHVGFISSILGALLMNSVLLYVILALGIRSVFDSAITGATLALIAVGAGLTHAFWGNFSLPYISQIV